MSKGNVGRILFIVIVTAGLAYTLVFRNQWPLFGEGGGSGAFFSGRKAVTEGRFQEGDKQLREYLDRFPNGKYASRAGFFRAKAAVGLGDLPLARSLYEKTIRDYPGTDEAHKSRYKIGMIDLWEGNRDRALAAFTSLAEKPDGPLSPEAMAMRDYLSGRTPRSPFIR